MTLKIKAVIRRDILSHVRGVVPFLWKHLSTEFLYNYQHYIWFRSRVPWNCMHLSLPANHSILPNIMWVIIVNHLSTKQVELSSLHMDFPEEIPQEDKTFSIWLVNKQELGSISLPLNKWLSDLVINRVADESVTKRPGSRHLKLQ